MTGVIKTVEKLNPLGGDGQQDEQRDAQQIAERASAPEEARSVERPVEDTEQVRVERAEEELEVEKTEREAGSIGVQQDRRDRERRRTRPRPSREGSRRAGARRRVDRQDRDRRGGHPGAGVREETVVTKWPVVKEEMRITKESHARRRARRREGAQGACGRRHPDAGELSG
jgi:hypothetical protein